MIVWRSSAASPPRRATTSPTVACTAASSDTSIGTFAHRFTGTATISAEFQLEKPVQEAVDAMLREPTGSTAHLLGELRQALGQTFVVDNRPGASAQIAATAVAKAPADGYTLMLTSNTTHSVNPHLFKKLPYDPVKEFTPIGGVAHFPFILAVNASLPVRTAQELVTYAQQNKGKTFYAYGTPTVQIPAEAINRLKNMGAIGVPYKSSPPALTDVVGGQAAQFLVVDLASAPTFELRQRMRLVAQLPATC